MATNNNWRHTIVGLVNYNFSRLPEPYKQWKAAKAPAASYLTHRHENIGGNPSDFKMNASIVEACLAYAMAEKGNIGVVQVSDGKGGAESSYAVQMELAEGILVANVTSNGIFHASLIDKANGKYQNLQPIGAKDYPLRMSAVMMALMLIEADKSRENNITEHAITWALLQKLRDDVSTSGEMMLNDVLLINDHLMAACNDTKDVVPMSLGPGNVVLPLKQKRVDAREFASGRIICGNPDILKPADARGTVVDAGNQTIGSLKADPDVAAYVATLNWTAQERLLIPQFPDDMIVQKEIAQAIILFVRSRKSRKQFNNFGWKGITGYGKSTGVAMMACILDTPLLWMTCSSNSDREWFMSAFVPDCGNANGKSMSRSQLPTFDDFYHSPSDVYEQLTGKRLPDEEVDEQMFLDARDEALLSHKPQYKIVESELVKALVRGYICEIQEYSRIRDAGVLTALNNMDKPGSTIPMVDGSTQFRHQNAIVFWTDNAGYVGCRPVDASVTRRIDVMFTSYEMDKTFVMSRLEQNFPEVTDKQLINKLYTVWSKVRTYCQDKEITDGDVSIVELENWLAYVQIFGEADLAESCMNCILAKAANDPETQAELLDYVKIELVKPY